MLVCLSITLYSLPCLNNSCSKVTNHVFLSVIALSDPHENKSVPFPFHHSSVCPWGLTLPALSLSPWSISHLPSSDRSLSLSDNHTPFRRTNPKYIPACQRNSLCAARWELCTVTLYYPPALLSPVSASPITVSHTHTHSHKHMHIQKRNTQTCTPIHSLVWAPECYCKQG